MLVSDTNSRRGMHLGWTTVLAAVMFSIPATLVADDDDDADALPPGVIMQPAFVLTPEQFDQWVFQGVGNADQALKQLDSQVTLRIEAINRACKLSDEQKQKLRLAATTDIKRFRDKYNELKQKLQNKQYNRNDVNAAFTELRPLQTEWNAGILGDASVFNKVLQRTLDPEQAHHSEQDEAQRSNFHYKAKVELAVASLESSVPMTDAQRQAFTKLLLADTDPPKVFGQYDSFVVMFQASKLPDEKLQAIFDAAQLRALQRAFQQSKAMEQMLKQQGIIPN